MKMTECHHFIELHFLLYNRLINQNICKMEAGGFISVLLSSGLKSHMRYNVYILTPHEKKPKKSLSACLQFRMKILHIIFQSSMKHLEVPMVTKVQNCKYLSAS